MVVRTIDEAKLSVTGSGNRIHWLVEKNDGSSTFEVRLVSIPPEGKSSKGHHGHEHGVYILSGQGRVIGEEGEYTLKAGVSVFVKGNEEHQWVNDSASESLDFICVIQSGAEDFIKNYSEEGSQ